MAEAPPLDHPLKEEDFDRQGWRKVFVPRGRVITEGAEVGAAGRFCRYRVCRECAEEKPGEVT